MDVRRLASIGSIVLGVLLILGGVATWLTVSSELEAQRIVTPEDACLPDREVDGPFTAYCQAQVIEKHALEATDGKTFAELEREDPLRDVAVQASFLRASLFTSVVAFGVAAMAAAMGVLFVLIGLGIRDVSEHVVPIERS